MAAQNWPLPVSAQEHAISPLKRQRQLVSLHSDVQTLSSSSHTDVLQVPSVLPELPQALKVPTGVVVKQTGLPSVLVEDGVPPAPPLASGSSMTAMPPQAMLLAPALTVRQVAAMREKLVRFNEIGSRSTN